MTTIPIGPYGSEGVMTQGLMPRMPHDHGYGGSRDFCLPTINCAVSSCPCNARGKCEMPSCITIGADGVCEMARRVFGKPPA